MDDIYSLAVTNPVSRKKRRAIAASNRNTEAQKVIDEKTGPKTH